MFKQLQFKSLLLLCALIVGSVSAWADDETVTFPTTSTNSTLTLPYVLVGTTNVTVTINKNSGTAAATNTDGLRIYAGGTIQFSSTTKKIEKIEFTYKRNKKITNGFTANTGTFTTAFTVENSTASNLSATWEASDNITSSVTFTLGSGSGNYALQSAKVTFVNEGGSNLTASDLAITGAPITLSFDLYNNSSAQTVSFTTSSTGAVTVSGGEGYVTTSVSGNTVTVTPVAVTPSAQTITVNQAADDTYAAGSATFTISVANSTPYVQPTVIDITPNYTFWGKTAQFSGDTYSGLSGSKDNVSLTWSKGNGSTYANQSAMRFYKDNTLKFTAPTGYEIISIKLEVAGTYNDLAFSPAGFDSESKTWTGASETVTMSRPSDALSYATISKFTITLGLPSSVATPTFSVASGTYHESQSVEISCETSGATIYYTTDGNDPTSSSTLYEGAISITESTTLKAIAIKDGESSNVASATYTIKLPLTLTVSNLVHVNTFVFAGDESETLFEGEGSAQIYEGTEVKISLDAEEGYVLQSLMVNGIEHKADIDGGMYIFTMPTNNVNVTATAVEATTYTIASSITSGKHYIIVGKDGEDSGYKAMGVQGSNNRSAVAVTENNGTITSAQGVYEFIIYGPDANGCYSIYDEEAPGYLYAASSSSNQLKTQASNNINGKWKIIFSNGVASIVADGSSNRNVMQYNSSSTLFSCYASASQSPVYLYEKDGDTPVTTTVSKSLNGFGYATFATTNALDFLDAEAENIDYSAWQITGVNGSTGVITFSQITNHVKAGTGILLKGAANANLDLNILPVGGAELSGNKLVGITTDFEVENDGEYYGLSGATFVKVKAGTVPAGKALLPATALNSNARTLTFVFEDATGISTIEHSPLTIDDAVYNLNGQRVNSPKSGLYIVNGKKVVMK